MRKNVCLKATWRQPWRTMLLLLFCAGLTFAFLSQVLQYWVIQDAVADSAGYYHAVGALRREYRGGGRVSFSVGFGEKRICRLCQYVCQQIWDYAGCI